jgi:hypothetical protein
VSFLLFFKVQLLNILLISPENVFVEDDFKSNAISFFQKACQILTKQNEILSEMTDFKGQNGSWRLWI